jgi:hypothetical protein
MVATMRKTLIILPLLLGSSPALAQSASQLPQQLTDPATMQRLAGTVQQLTNALLNIKVGEMQAAVEGRPATSEERNMTVGDMARRDDPDFDRHLHQKMAKAGLKLQRSMVAMNQALPEMMKDLKQAKKSLERAAANLPDPTYPRR